MLHLDLKNPTAQGNYVNNPFLQGAPVHWQDDVTGKMRVSVLAYLEQKIDPEQLELVIAYIQYHIHAPCWLEAFPGGKPNDEMRDQIIALREDSKKLKTIEDVNAYINKSLGIGLDPL
jgi:hypothetical protein